jgi:hypothetical protein
VGGGARLLLQQARTQIDVRVELRIDPLDRPLIDVGQRLGLHAPHRQPVQQLAHAGAAQVDVGDRCG